MMIAEVQAGDRAEWLRMRRALWPDCAEEMHRFEMDSLGAENAVFVFRRINGLLGGFVEASIRDRVDGSFSDRVAYVEGWYVDADLRANGIGRGLVEAAENWARARRLAEIASDAEIENPDSIAAHHALGFQETFRLVHFLKKLEP